VSASAFFEAYNPLNSDTLRVSEYRYIAPIFHFPTAREKNFTVIPGHGVIVGERDFGRRFQIGFQMNF